MSFDRESFFGYLESEPMHQSHLTLLRDMSSHIDDDTFAGVCRRYLKGEHSDIQELVRIMESTFEFVKDVTYYGCDMCDIDKVTFEGYCLQQLRIEFEYIDTALRLGFHDDAMSMIADVADAFRQAQSSPFFEDHIDFLASAEDDIRQSIGSDTVAEWFAYDQSE